MCSGIANYFNVDPVSYKDTVFGYAWCDVCTLFNIVGGRAQFGLYSYRRQRKRLFRDSDDKIIAGVCSGLAQYFSINVWIPRVLFLIPFFLLFLDLTIGDGGTFLTF